jgi:hypothetical protein
LGHLTEHLWDQIQQGRLSWDLGLQDHYRTAPAAIDSFLEENCWMTVSEQQVSALELEPESPAEPGALEALELELEELELELEELELEVLEWLRVARAKLQKISLGKKLEKLIWELQIRLDVRYLNAHC